MADVVGISFEGGSIRGVEIAERRSSIRVLRSGSVPTPDTAFDNEQVLDPEAVAQSLRDLWADAGFKTKRIRIGIDGRTAVVRRTELPKLDHARLREAAGYDIAELLSYDLDDAVFDVACLEEFDRDGTPWVKVLVASVDKRRLAMFREIVERAGLQFAGAGLVAEALTRSVESPAGVQGPTAIVDCEDILTNVVIRDERGILFARTLTAGIGDSNRSVAEELESALAQLGGDQGTASGAEANPPVTAVMTSGMSTVVEGVRRTIGYYQQEVDRRPLEAIVLTGSRSPTPNLSTSLADALGVPVTEATLTARWAEELDTTGLELPLGVALRHGRHLRTRLSLTSDEQRAGRARTRDRVAAGVLALTVGSGLALATVNDRAEARQASDELALTEQATETLITSAGEFDEVRDEIGDHDRLATDADELRSDRIRFPLVIRDLAEAMPPNSRLVTIQLRRADEESKPTGYVGDTPRGVISVTGITEDIEDVGRWLESIDEAATIEGVWLEQSTVGPLGSGSDVGAIFTVEGVINSAADHPPAPTEPAATDPAAAEPAAADPAATEPEAESETE